MSDGIHDFYLGGIASHYKADSSGVMTFGSKLKKLMKDQRYSQDMVAKQIGVSQGLISGWISGRYEPSVFQARDLAALLNVSLDYLVTEEATEMTSNQISPDDNIILTVVHSLGLDVQEVIRALNQAANDKRTGRPAARSSIEYMAEVDHTDEDIRIERERNREASNKAHQVAVDKHKRGGVPTGGDRKE